MYSKLIFLYVSFCNLGYYLTMLYIESLAIDKQSSTKIMKTKAYDMYPKGKFIHRRSVRTVDTQVGLAAQFLFKFSNLSLIR